MVKVFKRGKEGEIISLGGPSSLKIRGAGWANSHSRGEHVFYFNGDRLVQQRIEGRKDLIDEKSFSCTPNTTIRGFNINDSFYMIRGLKNHTTGVLGSWRKLFGNFEDAELIFKKDDNGDFLAKAFLTWQREQDLLRLDSEEFLSSW